MLQKEGYMPKLGSAAAFHVLRHSHQQVNRWLIAARRKIAKNKCFLLPWGWRYFLLLGATGIFSFPYLLLRTFSCCICIPIIQSWLKGMCYNRLNSALSLEIVTQVFLVLKATLVSKESKIFSVCFGKVGLPAVRFGKSEKFCCSQHKTGKLKLPLVTWVRPVITWIPTLIHPHFLCWAGNTKGRTSGRAEICTKPHPSFPS